MESQNYKIDGAALAEPHERRKHSRYPFTASVESVELKSQTRVSGRTGDLSLGGCYVDTTSSFPAGSVLKMRLTKDECTFEVKAVVVYSLVDMGMGVKFTYVDREQLGILRKWVEEIHGESLSQTEPTRICDHSCSSECPEGPEFQVLKDLITELMKQGVLSSAKSAIMLGKLTRAGHAKPHPIAAGAGLN
jgi:hypothetical protein